LFAASLAAAQFVDRLDDQREIHLVHLEPLAKLAEQRDGQAATEMLAELLQPGDHLQRAGLILVQQLVGE